MGEHLRGMFAVAVWDHAERHGVLIRDRLGIKPLYYALADGARDLRVGAEVRARERPRERRARPRGDRRLPDARLRARRDDPAAPGAQARAPASASWWLAGACRSSAGGTTRRPSPRTRPAEEWAELLLDKLDESVRLRLMSDVPLGAMLSGGLDSSLIVALMERHMSEPVKTFAVGFAGADSELADARRVADWNGTDHTELEVAAEDRPGGARRPRLAPRRAARRPLVARLPAALPARARAGDRRPHRTGSRRAARRLPQAPRGLAGRGVGEGPRLPARARRRRAASRPRPRRPPAWTPSRHRTRWRACSRRAASCTRT